VVTPPTPATPPPAAVTPKPVTLAAAVNQAQARKLPVPPSLKKFNTKELTGGYLHACIYGETSARKSTTAATFGTPENVRIILTRRKEQLIPLREKGYEAALVEDEVALNYALMYPEQLWPEWAGLPDRTLVLDDGTEAVQMLLEGASVIDGKEVRDRRRSYTEAGDQLREAVKVTLAKPQHFIMTALAKVRENALTNEERIAPDLPPSMQNLLMTEMEFVFYIKTRSWMFVTDREFQQIKETVEGREKIFVREIFAKHKLPVGLAGKGLITPLEKMDLADIWKRVKDGKRTLPTAVAPAK
jgi:hypothetical protein